MMREAERWLNQAKNDLEAAKWNSEGKFYAHACFLSQQAAEKALKAYLYSIGKSFKINKNLIYNEIELIP